MWNELEDNNSSSDGYNKPDSSSLDIGYDMNNIKEQEDSGMLEYQNVKYDSGYTFWSEQQKMQQTQSSQEFYSQSQYDYKDYNQSAYSKDGQSEYKVSSDDNNTSKKKNVLGRFLRFVAMSLVFGIIAGAGFQGFGMAYNAINPNTVASNSWKTNNFKSTGDKVQLTIVDYDRIIALETDLTNVVEDTMPSIVSIVSTVTMTGWDFWGNTFNEDQDGSGSGIIIAKTDTELLIATNNHVVSGSNKLQVTFIDQKVVEAEIKGTDASSDLAVIAIELQNISNDTLDAINIAKLGDSDEVKVGQIAIAIGNALGYGQSVTCGYISAKNREIHVDNKTMILLQTDAAINPGNSGGALLNINGEVVGINAVKYLDNEVEGMGYAIPISAATPIIEELMSKETVKESEKGFLGISGDDVTEDIAKKLNMPIGVYVGEVIANSAASKAGIMRGDIITKIADESVKGFNELKEEITSYRAGTTINITIQRINRGIYEEQVLEVTLKSKSE